MCIIPFNSSQTGFGEPGLRVIFKVGLCSSKMHLSSRTSKLQEQFAMNFQCGVIPGPLGAAALRPCPLSPPLVGVEVEAVP